MHRAKADPIRLARATIQAVDRIGAATYEEIEKTADEIMRQEASVQLQQSACTNCAAHRGRFQQVERTSGASQHATIGWRVTISQLGF
jgi:hypothetical protein